MRPFAYASAGTIEETLLLLGDAGDALVRPLAGGTDLLTLMKAEVATPAQLVDIKRLADLDDRIEVSERGIEIGALATLAELETSALIREWCPALAEAAAQAATPQLRNMATVGGNLLQRPRCWYFRNPRFHCWLKGGEACQARSGENQHHAVFDVSPCVAVHPSDLASALVALDAELELRGPAGERTVALGEFFAPPTVERRRENVLGGDELIVSLRLPMPPATARSVYLKAMDRKAWAFALVGVAASLRLDGGRIAEPRLILSGVAPIPWRAAAAEATLVGAEPGADLFAEAAAVALAGATPLAQNGYKVPLADALIRRALAKATGIGAG